MLWVGVYGVKSTMVFGMPGVEFDKHRSRHSGMMNFGQNSQHSFDAQPCKEGHYQTEKRTMEWWIHWPSRLVLVLANG
jgi:hypothetical protein